MADRIAAWAKNLEQRGNFFGILLRLLYEICVNAQFQSAVHVIASCVLGAFCYKNGKPNVCFLIVFAVTYLIIIVTFTSLDKGTQPFVVCDG